MINVFDGDYAWLSNFAYSPFECDGWWYPTVEHYFQAAKTLDIQEYKSIVAAATPGQAKRLGRRITLRPDWEKVKDQIMLDAVRLKFTQNDDLRAALLATGDEYLEEGNWWGDRYWGVYYANENADGIGQNKLGQILMQVREEMRNGDY